MNKNNKQQQKLISLDEDIIVKTSLSVAKLTLVVGMLLATSSCTTTKLGQDYPHQGKVWRGDIVQQFLEVPDLNALETRASAKMPYDPANPTFWRFAKVRVLDGGFFKDMHIGAVHVPDNVEYADLEKGAIVDVIFQKGSEFDWRLRKISRVIRLVCAGHDKECISRERSAGRVNTVIDAAPESGFQNGNTYTRQVSAEERTQYR